MKLLRFAKNNHGSVLVWTIFTIAIFFLVVSATTMLIIAELRQSNQINNSVAAYYAAEVGIERAKNHARRDIPATSATNINVSNATIGTSTYSFVVAKKGGNYDSPSRACSTWDYCFYSEGKAGTIKRRLNGYLNAIPLTQSKMITLSDSNPDTGWFSPAALLLGQNVRRLDIPPAPPSTPGYMSGASYFYFRATQVKFPDLASKSGIYLFGVTDGAQMIKIWVNNGEVYLQFPDNTETSRRISLRKGGVVVDSFTLELTYLEGGSQPVTTLRVADDMTLPSPTCFDSVTTYGHLSDMNLDNTDIFFKENSPGTFRCYGGCSVAGATNMIVQSASVLGPNRLQYYWPYIEYKLPNQ